MKFERFDFYGAVTLDDMVAAAQKKFDEWFEKYKEEIELSRLADSEVEVLEND